MTGPHVNLQPSDLRSNAYKGLPGGHRGIFSLLFSRIYIQELIIK